MKRCAKCKGRKPEIEFHRSKERRDGFHPYCKLCRQQEAQNRAEMLRAYKKSWYRENRESVLARVAARAKESPSKIKASRKRYYLANAEKVKANVVVWQKANPHIVAWRTLLHTTLRKLGRRKTERTIETLGYSAQEFRLHIESLWTPGMTWDNYGSWHVDHIRPVRSFQRDTSPKVVNALKNLRPLWATTRIIDGVWYEGNLNRSKRWEAGRD